MTQHRQTRVEAAIALLLARKHQRVSLPEVQQAAGAQHGARIAEARALGYVIDNEMEHTADGQVHSWYILRAEPGEAVTPSLFGEHHEPTAPKDAGSYPD